MDACGLVVLDAGGLEHQGFLSRVWDAIAGVPRNPSDASTAPSSGSGRQEKLFLPTGSLQLFQSLHRALPEHHLMAADFSYFASGDVRIAGTNAPIVSHTVRCCCTRLAALVSLLGGTAARGLLLQAALSLRL